jgi:DNA-directed RNA polymerase subunit RPC12/RpoP
MAFIMRNESFVCENCNKNIPAHPDGSARNHCPFCLHSKHVDEDFPGDRAATCHGLMEPIDIDYKKNKGNMLLHKCKLCGKEILNKIAPDDDFLPFIQKLNKKR